MTSLQETALRELLESPDGKEYVRAFAQVIEGGARLKIPMDDGTVHQVTTVPQFLEVLIKHFGQSLCTIYLR
jgi:hypothetical protein